MEDRIIEDVGQQPREGIGGRLSRRRLPAQLQAEAGVVQAADSECELQQVILVLCLVPPSLQERQEGTTCELVAPDTGDGWETWARWFLPGEKLQ